MPLHLSHPRAGGSWLPSDLPLFRRARLLRSSPAITCVLGLKPAKYEALSYCLYSGGLDFSGPLLALLALPVQKYLLYLLYQYKSTIQAGSTSPVLSRNNLSFCLLYLLYLLYLFYQYKSTHTERCEEVAGPVRDFFTKGAVVPDAVINLTGRGLMTYTSS